MQEVEDIWSGTPLLSQASTERPVFRLEIPLQWMLWRIYHADEDPWRISRDEGSENEVINQGDVKDEGRDLQVAWDWRRYGYVRSEDPMDEEDFDDAASFPAFKPDRDLFRPLRRCRKVRGWHYVKRWPSVTPKIETMTLGSRTTGADIPPELFDNIILGHLAKWGGKEDGTMRLVCRHWERACMREHFRLISLKTHEDVMNIVAGLEQRQAQNWPVYPVQFLRLRLDVAENSLPWIHTVQTKLVPNLDVDPYTTLEITGPLPAGRRLTSIHLASPCRSMWRPLCIQSITLEDLHFRKLNDLVQVLRAMPFLKDITGTGITWDALGDVYPRATSFIPVPRPYLSRFTTKYSFEDCPRGLAATLACALSPSGIPPIAQSDANLLCALTAALDSTPNPLRQLSWRTDRDLVACNNAVHIGLTLMQSRLQARTVQFIALDTLDRHVHSVDLSSMIPWKTVADIVAKLIAQPDLFLVFTSLQAASTFHQDVSIPTMSRLVSQGRVRYVLEGTCTWSLIATNEDNTWRVLDTEHDMPAATDRENLDPNNPRSTIQLVRKLVARLPDH